MKPTLVLILCLTTLPAWSQARPYPGADLPQLYQHYLDVVNNIPAFDHHAHPGFADDPDVDAMAAPPGSAAFRERDTNPELVAAAKALWGYPYADFSPEHAKWLVQKKAEMRKQYAGTAYFNMLLDKLNFDRGVANRAMMADYLDAKRFPWVFFVDAFMWPFDNTKERSRNGDQEVYIPLQEKMLKRWMQQEKVSQLPAGFGDYLKFISQVLEDNQKNKGGIAIKFEVPYFRTLHFNDPSRDDAEAIYKKYVKGGVPSEPEYRTFQDYVFRFLVTEGGRLKLPVHIHSAVGIGDYFNISDSNIMQLENVLRDPRYSATTFVMIHGGYPLEREAIWLAAMKNVYMESSLMEIIMYPAAFKDSLRQWLETFPDKVTFGTDCFPYNDVLGAEESYWLGAQSARQGLAAALAEMVSSGEITDAKAIEMAHAYLHDTAVSLYPSLSH
ncbi:MAG: amidohydrolase family protein [Acidobacteriales bacterium]|nr:amidohydrolase family protein [Candidatus Koribacter versatilis]MBI3644672.1 amidohydrolase family protein [Terriglobales bacterium]